MMMSMEQLVECLAGETEVLGQNLPQCCFALSSTENKVCRVQQEEM
jgi:hypothetical protein